MNGNNFELAVRANYSKRGDYRSNKVVNSQKAKKWVCQAGMWGISPDCAWHNKGFLYPRNPRYVEGTTEQNAQRWRDIATEFDRHDRPTLFEYYQAMVYNRYYWNQRPGTEEQERYDKWVPSFHVSLSTIFDDIQADWNNPPEDLVKYCCDKLDEQYDGTKTVYKKLEDRPGSFFKATQVGTAYPRKEISQTKEYERTMNMIHRATNLIQHGKQSVKSIADRPSSRPVQTGASSSYSQASSSTRASSYSQASTKGQSKGRQQDSRSSRSNPSVHVAGDVDVYGSSRPSRSQSSTNPRDDRNSQYQNRDDRSRPGPYQSRSSSNTQRYESGRDNRDSRSNWDHWYKDRRN